LNRVLSFEHGIDEDTAYFNSTELNMDYILDAQSPYARGSNLYASYFVWDNSMDPHGRHPALLLSIAIGLGSRAYTLYKNSDRAITNAMNATCQGMYNAYKMACNCVQACQACEAREHRDRKINQWTLCISGRQAYGVSGCCYWNAKYRGMRGQRDWKTQQKECEDKHNARLNEDLRGMRKCFELKVGELQPDGSRFCTPFKPGSGQIKP
jgi:hypothetical protein